MEKQMNWQEFSSKYCARQQQTPEGLHAVLTSQISRFDSDGFMLLECQQMDSSRCGELVILGFGGTHTYKEIPSGPISPRGLASDMSVVIGWVSRTQVVTES